MKRAMVTLTVALACAACVAITGLDNAPLGTTCHLKDESAKCGACIAAQCGRAVTGCCADSACKTSLDAFDACAKGGSCAVSATGAAASALAGCIASACAKECAASPASDAGACAPPSGSACSVDPQCGCASNETCEVDLVKLDGTTACVRSNNPSADIGARCGSTAGCKPGLACVFGTCRPYCSKDGSPCTQAGTSKCVQLMNNNAPVPGLLVCYLGCALEGAGCPSGFGCVYGGTDLVDCRDFTQYCGGKCSPGQACNNGACARWCAIGSVCGGGKTCAPQTPKVTVGGKEYGLCL